MKKLTVIISCILIHTQSFSQEEFCKKNKKNEQLEYLNKQFLNFKKTTELRILELEKKISEQQKNLNLLNNDNIKNDIEIFETQASTTVSYSLQNHLENNSKKLVNRKNYIPQIISFNPKNEITNITINNALFTQSQKKVQVFINFSITTIGFDKNPYVDFLVTIPHNQKQFKNKYEIIGMGNTEIIDWLRGESSFTVAAEPGTSFARIKGKFHTDYNNTSSNVMNFVYELN